MSSSRHRIVIRAAGQSKYFGELIRFLAPRTVDRILKNLPISGRASALPGGFYLSLPIQIGNEKATRILAQGDIAFWLLGNSLCFFIQNARSYSPMNVVGKIVSPLDEFKQIPIGTQIQVARVGTEG